MRRVNARALCLLAGPLATPVLRPPLPTPHIRGRPLRVHVGRTSHQTPRPSAREPLYAGVPRWPAMTTGCAPGRSHCRPCAQTAATFCEWAGPLAITPEWARSLTECGCAPAPTLRPVPCAARGGREARSPTAFFWPPPRARQRVHCHPPREAARALIGLEPRRPLVAGECVPTSVTTLETRPRCRALFSPPSPITTVAVAIPIPPSPPPSPPCPPFPPRPLRRRPWRPWRGC